MKGNQLDMMTLILCCQQIYIIIHLYTYFYQSIPIIIFILQTWEHTHGWAMFGEKPATFVSIIVVRIHDNSDHFFSSPGQRPCELLPSGFVRRRRLSLAFHVLIFSSETTEPNQTKLCWNGPWTTPFQCPITMPFIQDGCHY